MAEYYTVLKRAVGGLDPNVADARRAVYDKARNALIGQLKAVEPPLTTAEISRQRLELEEAIRRVERETAAGVVGAAVAPPPGRVAPPPPPPSAPPIDRYSAPPEPAAEPPAASPQDVFRRAMQEAGIRGSEAGAAGARMERLPVRAREAEAPRGRPAEPPAYRADTAYRAPEPAYPPEPEYAPEPTYRREAEYQRAPAYEPPPQRDYQGGGRGDPPRLAPDYGQDWDRGAAASGPVVDRRDRPAGVKTKTRRRGYLEEERDELEEAPRRSRLPTIFLFVLILGMLGGLGALAWSQRAVITDLLASFDAGGADAPPAAAPAASADPASGKNADRLLEGEAPAPPKDVRVVNPEDAPGDGATAVAALDDGADPAAAAPLAAPDAAIPATAADDASGDALVAQKAILYEEPLNGAANGVTAINAAVTWRYLDNGPNGPEIEASLDVPDRGMKIRFSLHKNTDDTLPASHLVEVVVDTPPDFPGKAVASVPRIVLKPTEESRGQPLVGAAAKVADGFFWIALSANQADVAANLQLIRERNWIDLPLVYDNGQRAILTFEKGTPGGRVLEKALAAWGNGQSG